MDPKRARPGFSLSAKIGPNTNLYCEGGISRYLTVDVAKVELSAEEQEGAEEKDEKYGPGDVRIVHDVLVDAAEGVENCECLYYSC